MSTFLLMVAVLVGMVALLVIVGLTGMVGEWELLIWFALLAGAETAVYRHRAPQVAKA